MPEDGMRRKTKHNLLLASSLAVTDGFKPFYNRDCLSFILTMFTEFLVSCFVYDISKGNKNKQQLKNNPETPPTPPLNKKNKPKKQNNRFYMLLNHKKL